MAIQTAQPSHKRALLVHAHSESDSFVTAMRDRIATTLAQQEWLIEHSDLYLMRFNPVLSSADFPARKDDGHLTIALEQRHGFAERKLAPDVLAEVDKVLAADLVVFTFPVFWFSVPAILKGWIDRVFLSGPFYGGRRIYDHGGLTGKKALVVMSLGGREHMFGARALHGELETGMLRHFLQGTLGYVGFKVIQPFVAYHTPYITQDEREGVLEDLAVYSRNIDAHQTMTMPELAHFDPIFRLL